MPAPALLAALLAVSAAPPAPAAPPAVETAPSALAAAAPPPAEAPAPFALRARIIPAPPAVPAPQRVVSREMVCRTTLETGSLVAKRKMCLTRSQWEYVDNAHREEARKLMMDNMGKSPL